jgi:hypothetical protein
MKKLYFITLFAFTCVIANAQTCSWLKGGTAGSSYSEGGDNIATDMHGNVYVTGDFQGPSITLGSTVVTNQHYSNNQSGLFIAKYAPSGNLLWVRSTDGGGILDITCDKFGNVYITGTFDPTMILGTYTITTVGANDFFIAKYDSSGNALWAKSAGGVSNSEMGNAITTDNSGNVIVSGEFYSTSMTIGTYTLTNFNTQPDYFIAKYDSSGNVLWASAAGGNRYDIGNSVSTDMNNNIYSVINYNSDSIKMGSTTLYSPAPGSGNLVVTKYDSLGNIGWAKQIITGALGMSVGIAQIVSEASGDYYLTGAYGGTLTIGNDTLFFNNGGNTDIFIAKYNSSGNPLWARGASSSNYDDYTRGISLDNAGNPHIAGFFIGPSIAFGSNVLTNPHPNQATVFVAKYDVNGNAQWAQGAVGGNSYSHGEDVAVGTGSNVYLTGNFFSSSLSFPGSTIPNSGTYDYFVADIYPFSASITSYTNVSCNGGNNGTVIANASGGNLPYTYNWSFSPSNANDTLFTASNDTAQGAAGYYSITITEGFGCSQVFGVNITEPPADSVHICMVTVDSASQHNIIIWDKTSFTNIDSFVVYREIATNNYQPIGAVSFDSLSRFIDTVRTKYFPNTGDPNAGTYRYKLKGYVSCGGYTGLGPFHNTIYILNNAGTFYWTQPYTIQGSGNPVSSYVLMRDNLSNGNWIQVSSVAGTQQTVSDPLYSIYQSTASWRVQTNWSITCVPTLRMNNAAQNNYSSSYSNVYTNNPVAITNNTFNAKLNVYPNPSNGKFVLEYYSLEKNKNGTVEVYNMIGKKVYSQNELPPSQTTFDFSSLPSGVYFLNFKTENNTVVKKIVIQ